jgi:hypothetical protein
MSEARETPWARRAAVGKPNEDSESEGPLLAILLGHQRASWRQGKRLPVETYLAERPALPTEASASST